LLIDDPKSLFREIANTEISKLKSRPPFECIALLLQGGGALGAYQAGVFQALAEENLHPDWVAGISIGAINSALIAGNPPETRVDKLRSFWEAITAASAWEWSANLLLPFSGSLEGRKYANQMDAASAMFTGVAGLFTPRMLTPWLQPPGGAKATSYYDTSSLQTTIERLVDFDLINAGNMRFSVGAVNVRSGNFAYFDTETDTIRPQHIMASAALPPGFPPIEIEGEYYWDGGLVSNTPLQWVLQYGPRRDTLAFQVDLWNARGKLPRNMAQVTTRQKEILYSSRTRDNTDQFTTSQAIRHAVQNLLKKLPNEMKKNPEVETLSSFGDQKVYSLVHLIYRAKQYEGDSKDYDFSRLSMEEHWRSGYNDAVRTLQHPEALARPENAEGVSTFDIADHDDK
jgi:NTE family protein